MDFQETWNVCEIKHSPNSITSSETLVCKILYGCYLHVNNCKIQVLGETNNTSIAENKLYWYSEYLNFV